MDIVIIPTYNEADNIRQLIHQILALKLDLSILVVDDNSPDGTARLVEEMNQPGVTVLRRLGPKGYGRAVLDGFRHALVQGAQRIIAMDADHSHDPGVIPRLLDESTRADVVIGSRYCPDGGTINWPIRRIFLSQGANTYVRRILKIPVMDCTSGFRCYHRSVLEHLDLDQIRSEGYSFLVEVLYRSYLSGARIHEIPILFKDRMKGKSKISTREIYRSIYLVLWMKLKISKMKGTPIHE